MRLRLRRLFGTLQPSNGCLGPYSRAVCAIWAACCTQVVREIEWERAHARHALAASTASAARSPAPPPAPEAAVAGGEAGPEGLASPVPWPWERRQEQQQQAQAQAAGPLLPPLPPRPPSRVWLTPPAGLPAPLLPWDAEPWLRQAEGELSALVVRSQHSFKSHTSAFQVRWG